MTIRRSLLVALGLLTLAVACGDDDAQVIYVTPDSGPLVTTEDAGICEPINVPTQSFNDSPLNQKVCTDAEIKTLLDACIFNGSVEACEKARTDLGPCGTCLVGDANSQEAHPLYQFARELAPSLSLGACLLTEAKTPQEIACARGFGQLETCTRASCMPPCANATDESFQACLRAAINSTCTAGIDAVGSQECGARYEDDTYGFCSTGKNSDGTDMTNLQFFTAISKIYCGSPGGPDDGGVDSGIVDSGSTDQ